MPAFGIGTPIFLIAQGLISLFVYSEAKKYSFRFPLIVGISVFVLGVAAAFVFRTVIELVGIELILILLYHIAQVVLRRRASSS